MTNKKQNGIQQKEDNVEAIYLKKIGERIKYFRKKWGIRTTSTLLMTTILAGHNMENMKLERIFN